MNETHKLLLAFIDAMGYEVKEEKYVILNDGTRYEGHERDTSHRGVRKFPILNYKVTKKVISSMKKINS